MRVWLLRHGETDYNAQQKYLGRTDLPLSERGRRALARAEFSPEVVYVSPLRRTAETAGILFPGARQIPVSGLQEMDFGLFEGKSWREMERLPAYRAWVDGGCVDAPPGGESRAQFCARVCAAVQALLDGAAAAGAERLVIVAHGGTQMAALERFALPRRDYFSWNGPLGGGFVLDGSRWETEQILTVLETVRYTRGEKHEI